MTATNTSRRHTIMVYSDDAAWVDTEIPGPSSAERWHRVLQFWQERKGRMNVEIIGNQIKSFFESKPGRNLMREIRSD